MCPGKYFPIKNALYGKNDLDLGCEQIILV